MRRSLIAIGVLPFALLVPVASAAAPKPFTFTDPADDAGINPRATATALPPATAAGLDLVKGSVSRKGANLLFSATTSQALPTYGSLPEAARLIWQFTVGKSDQYRLTVKSFDVGKPDPVQQDGTDRIGKVYDKGEFRLEHCGESVAAPAVLTFSSCSVVAQLTGAINASAKTLSWTLPLALIKAKTGTPILMGAGTLNDTGCEICFIAHYGERSLSPDTIIDNVLVDKPKYVVPKG